MMIQRKSIAVDMDGVIADTAAQFLHWYEVKYGVKITKQDIHGKSELDALPNGAAKKFVFESGFFRGVPVMEGAKEAVKELMKHYDVYIVSAAMEFPHHLRKNMNGCKNISLLYIGKTSFFVATRVWWRLTT
jgi:5'(3')-deoxyribonucleotidase